MLALKRNMPSSSETKLPNIYDVSSNATASLSTMPITNSLLEKSSKYQAMQLKEEFKTHGKSKGMLSSHAVLSGDDFFDLKQRKKPKIPLKKRWPKVSFLLYCVSKKYAFCRQA